MGYALNKNSTRKLRLDRPAPMIEAILPAEVASVATMGTRSSARLFAEEAAQLGRVVPKRMREFATGRHCARSALRKLGLSGGPILQGSQREPIWPPGIAGSITHCDGYCAAAVARRWHVRTIGIDAEVHDKLPEGVADLVLVEEERLWLSKAPGGVHWDRLLFSAKESVFKAWFPITELSLDFKDALIVLSLEDNSFYAKLVRSTVMASLDLTTFSGKFLVRGRLILTSVTAPS